MYPPSNSSCPLSYATTSSCLGLLTPTPVLSMPHLFPQSRQVPTSTSHVYNFPQYRPAGVGEQVPTEHIRGPLAKKTPPACPSPRASGLFSSSFSLPSKSFDMLGQRSQCRYRDLKTHPNRSWQWLLLARTRSCASVEPITRKPCVFCIRVWRLIFCLFCKALLSN